MNFDNELLYLQDWWTRHIAYLDANVFIPYPAGDTNFDRKVDMDDLSKLINHLLGIKQKRFNENKADYDQNGQVDMDDLSKLINYLLDQSASPES